MSDQAQGGETDATPVEPVLRIMSPGATAEDIATLTVLFTSMSGGDEPPAETSNWLSTARKGRYAPRPAPAAWRLAARGR